MNRADTGVSVLVVGDLDTAEFSAARADLEPAGAHRNGEDVLPDLIVVAQSHPGQFSDAELDRLARRTPHARLVGLLGSCCEGEMRSGTPWPGMLRVYWHQWPGWWRRQLERLAKGECPEWGYPPTFTEEDRVLASARSALPHLGGSMIGIAANSDGTVEFLTAACRAAGGEPLRIWPDMPMPAEPLSAVWFDSNGDEDDFQRIERLAKAIAPGRVVVLMDFPRPEDVERARLAGAATVLSKPIMLEDLWREMESREG